MQVIKILSSGVLLTFGTLFLLVSLVIAFEKEPSQRDKDAFLGGLVLGIPATVLGGLLAWNLYGTSRRTNRLQTAFFQTLRAGNGRITPLAFAMAANLSGEEARAYLDARAKEFFGNFEVDDGGGIFYTFNLAHLASINPTESVSPRPIAPLPSLMEGTWEVVVYSVPDRQKIAAIKIVRELTGLGLKDSKERIEKTPCTMMQGISRERAYQVKQQLEEIGVIVSIVEK